MLRIATIGNRFVLTCMVVGTMVVGSASAVLAAPVSSDDELEHMGLVEAMPDGGGAGTWVIGGETFTADEDTEFETDEGTLEVGACAEVEYEADADGNLALEIEGEDSPDCIDDEEEDDADDDAHDDEMDEDDADENEADDTEGDAEDGTTESTEGGNAVNADGSGSAEVRLMSNVSGAAQNQDPPDSGSNEVEDPNDTEEDEADDEADDDDEDDADELEHMGLVEVMPDGGGAGTWVIGGETFTADENTEFETDEGALEMGACAEVEYEAGADGNLALEIEGEDSPDCVDDEDDADDDMDDADEDEADDSEDADATEGDADGSGTSESGTGSAADAGGTGSAEVRLMNNVSGANQNQDPPDTGSTEVEDPNDTEEDEAEEDEADEDEADEDEADEDEEDENEVFGTIETMPAGSDAPLGTWVVDGVSYVATADTEIEEEYGPFEVGANVELEFEIVDGVNQLTELETEPAPGEAPNTTEGVINSKGGAVVAAAVSGSTAADATWVIGNTEYTVLGITAQEGALAVGSMAQVNSYTHADGREIATLIRNVETQNFMYLPIVLQHG